VLALGELAPPLSAPKTAGGAANRLEIPFNPELPLAVAREAALGEFERRYVEKLLEAHAGKSSDAARAAGVGRRYFNVLRARYKL
jgi:hypothetical protein